MPYVPNDPRSPDYFPENGLCRSCDSELVPQGDRLEPDLVCVNPQCPENGEQE